MHWLDASVIGIVVGSGVGWTAEHLRVASVVQSVAPFSLAVVLGDMSTLVWWPRGRDAGQVGSVYLAFAIDNLFG